MMNTVVIWIFIPIGISIVLMLLQRFAKLSTAITLISSVILIALAYIMPEDLIIRIGQRQIIFLDSFEIFGRLLSITKANLSLITGLYLCVFLWNSIARSFEMSQWFNAFSMLIAALWVTALAVQPFLYAAVIILIIAIVSIPILSPRGTKAGRGVLRYIIFQAIAMPLILLSSWMLSDIETAPSANALILRAALLVLSGFAFWLALFPVHTWVPMVAKESHPWPVSFLLVLMQSSLTIFFLYFLEEYSWLRNLPQLWEILRWSGIVLLLIASLLLSFQTQIRRVLAYLYLWEMGYALLAIGLTQQGGISYLQIVFMPRMLGFAGISYNIARLEQLEADFDGNIDQLSGLFYRYPMTSTALMTSLLSIAGLPILASFPAKRYIINLLPWSGYGMEMWLSLGYLGILMFAFKLIHKLISPPNKEKPVPLISIVIEDLRSIIFNSILIFLLLLVGVFPGLFSEVFEGILSPFSKIFLAN